MGFNGYDSVQSGGRSGAFSGGSFNKSNRRPSRFNERAFEGMSLVSQREIEEQGHDVVGLNGEDTVLMLNGERIDMPPKFEKASRVPDKGCILCFLILMIVYVAMGVYFHTYSRNLTTTVDECMAKMGDTTEYWNTKNGTGGRAGATSNTLSDEDLQEMRKNLKNNEHRRKMFLDFAHRQFGEFGICWIKVVGVSLVLGTVWALMTGVLMSRMPRAMIGFCLTGAPLIHLCFLIFNLYKCIKCGRTIMQMQEDAGAGKVLPRSLGKNPETGDDVPFRSNEENGRQRLGGGGNSDFAGLIQDIRDGQEGFLFVLVTIMGIIYSLGLAFASCCHPDAFKFTKELFGFTLQALRKNYSLFAVGLVTDLLCTLLEVCKFIFSFGVCSWYVGKLMHDMYVEKDSEICRVMYDASLSPDEKERMQKSYMYQIAMIVAALGIWMKFGHDLVSISIRNVLSLGTCKVFAAWYFCLHLADHYSVKVSAFGGWCTAWAAHFGTAVYGAAVISIVRMIRNIVGETDDGQNSGGVIGALLRCLIMCILRMIENLLRFLNEIAFVHVSVYNFGYCEAVKSTMKMFKACGFEFLLGNKLVDKVLDIYYFTASFTGAYLASLICGDKCLNLFGNFVNGAIKCFCNMTEEQAKVFKNAGGKGAGGDGEASVAAGSEEFAAAVDAMTNEAIAVAYGVSNMVLSMVIYGICHWIIGNMLESGRQIIMSGFNTLFVCYAEFPQGLEVEDPTFADIMRHQIRKNGGKKARK